MSEQPATPVAAVHDRRPSLTERRSILTSRASTLARLPARAVDALLWLYQKLVSPALQVAAPSCGCRFAPTCSHYARAALREHGLFAGLGLTLRRLAKCGPWHPGGLDPVPRKKFSCIKVSSQITPAES